ncbi:DUF4326 domain-containing protein [Roseomonas indoligenes]|uniref:DUF4326 domain-containing protein n=1 Tax=Roseomonas indoligenes TaxID=2820811 RepID=A0A940S4Q4_9PROT|nr:DUF4326 domain-containing protein [Pararoseomonas indoligenes]MBP0492224.1 DUF4326 domain-containing protein [Pararoseomonas indoligenes]
METRAPTRVQLSRKKGWRMPENTVKVDRTSRWGNPFRATGHTPQQVVDHYRHWLEVNPSGRWVTQLARTELRGLNLACWCKPGAPCHADVLLEIANA